MPDYQLGIIGVGNMGEAILRGIVGANVLPHSSIVAAEPRLEVRQMVTRDLGITAVEDAKLAAQCQHVLLAVKPQMMDSVLASVADHVRADAVVISIAAGVRTGWLDDKLRGRGRIVRVMPNTPMLIGAGMSALCKGPRASDAELKWTAKLFATGGKTVTVTERMMDAVTAVSGSGPAYFFYLVEAMIAAGTAEGLDADTARTLAVETCAGAAALLRESGEAPEVLRAKVTSPGGTTEAAIRSLDQGGAKDLLTEAVRDAARRSRELGE